MSITLLIEASPRECNRFLIMHQAITQLIHECSEVQKYAVPFYSQIEFNVLGLHFLFIWISWMNLLRTPKYPCINLGDLNFVWRLFSKNILYFWIKIMYNIYVNVHWFTNSICCKIYHMKCTYFIILVNSTFSLTFI